MGAAGALLTIAFIGLFLGLAGTAAVVGALAYGIRRGVYALKGQPYRPLLGAGNQPAFEHQDVDMGSSTESVKSVLKRYMSVDGAGKYAREGLSVLDAADRKAANFHAVLDTKFQPGSITWDKFAVAASNAQEAVLRNCASLANAVQVFDYADYRRLEQTRRRSAFRSDARLDGTQLEQYHLLKSKLTQMHELNESSEKMLFELDKLISELNTLDNTGSSTESEHLIAEIRTLTDETKYYKQRLDDMD